LWVFCAAILALGQGGRFAILYSDLVEMIHNAGQNARARAARSFPVRNARACSRGNDAKRVCASASDGRGLVLASVKATTIVSGWSRCIILPGQPERRSCTIAPASFDQLKRKNQISFARN